LAHLFGDLHRPVALIAEGGLLFVAQGWAPMGLFATLTGSGAGTWLPVTQLTPLSFIQAGFTVDMRGFIMPSFVQSFKLAHDNGIRRAPVAGADWRGCFHHVLHGNVDARAIGL
jgi:hypothetical protein